MIIIGLNILNNIEDAYVAYEKCINPACNNQAQGVYDFN